MGIINILKWALSVIQNRRITKKEIIRHIEKMTSEDLTLFINQHRARKNREKRRITVKLEACRRVLLTLKDMLNDAKNTLQKMIKR